MTEYNFRLLFDAPTELSDDYLNRLYEATGADATIGSDSDGWSAEFDRTAPDFITAVMSALGEVERAGFPVRLLASEDDALVNASEIARRTEKSREAIRLYVEGERHRELGPALEWVCGPGGWRRHLRRQAIGRWSRTGVLSSRSRVWQKAVAGGPGPFG